ncbi:serine/threonine-protein kinase [Streptomyces litchfieldiae]|uniref:Serine/threonine-protein kinase n=1 Tax=Streptomyces litchfieldiae TaxID=3075543 RepID=A0ABU2MSW5_9ACTN|nr:serine/threonine-protein kinase [Streptomyces sp. DSM 44938]MDT0344487.1 serine/threonine-protein kinase [Streptomyces sp. DSM 44938]
MEDLLAGDPREVGPYRLLKRLGGGGMGQVFLGRSRRGARLVAVKVVRPELAGDADFRRRFVREVEAARQVGGFYTAHVVDADPEADPPWLAAAYIPGPSLQQAVARHGPLPERALGPLAAGLAEGLAAVHDCQMVHRDLKPGNVLLAADGPRLIDFGIARAAEDTQLTRAGTAIGTPGFMAPEHLLGNDAGPESDVFALGAVLSYAATGRLPFGTGPAHAVNYRVVHEEPDLSGLPAPLAELVGDCLAKDAPRRPTVVEILDRVPAPDDTGISWLPSTVTTMIDERTVAPPESPPPSSASGGADDHTRSLPHHVDALIGLANVEGEGNPAEARRLFQQAIEAGGTPEQTAGALISLGWLEKQAGNLDEARGLYQRIIEIGNAWQQAKALLCWGVLEKDDAGDVEKVRGLYQRAAESGQWGIAPDAWGNLGRVEREAGNVDAARGLFQRATEAPGPPEQIAGLLMTWADMELGAGNRERARQLYKQVLDVT